MKNSIIYVGLVLVTFAPASYAHHSIAGAYDQSQSITFEGTVAHFHFVNPHPFVVVQMKDGNGVQDWTLEMDNRRELVEIGMHENTLRAGDRVVVTGSPGRNQPRKLYIRRLERPEDGFLYQQVSHRPSVGSTRSQAR